MPFRLHAINFVAPMFTIDLFDTPSVVFNIEFNNLSLSFTIAALIIRLLHLSAHFQPPHTPLNLTNDTLSSALLKIPQPRSASHSRKDEKVTQRSSIPFQSSQSKDLLSKIVDLVD